MIGSSTVQVGASRLAGGAEEQGQGVVANLAISFLQCYLHKARLVAPCRARHHPQLHGRHLVDPPGMEGFGPTIGDRALTVWHMISTYYRERKRSTDKLKTLSADSEQTSLSQRDGGHHQKVGALLCAAGQQTLCVE